MKVSATYYMDMNYHRPEVVTSMVKYFNNIIKSGAPERLMAKRLKCLCIKNYRGTIKRPNFFCKSWEQQPILMLMWFHERDPQNRHTIKRVNRAKGFEPGNISFELRTRRIG